MKLIKSLDIVPIPKPRQTRADVWKNPARPAVQRYRDYKDEMRLVFKPEDLPEHYLLVFFLPMAKSWSKKKKKTKNLTPHTSKPDKDNLEKAFLDSLYSTYDGKENSDDSGIWDGRTIKLWGYEGRIDIYEIPSVLDQILKGCDASEIELV